MEILFVKMPICLLFIFVLYLLIFSIIPDIRNELKNLFKVTPQWDKPAHDESNRKIKILQREINERILNNG